MSRANRTTCGPTAILILLISVSGPAQPGCSLNEGGGSGGISGAGGEGGSGGIATSTLRVTHLAVAVPAIDSTLLDFIVVDEGSFNGIAFGRVSQSVVLPSGVHQLSVVVPGGEEPLASVTWELEADVHYTAVAYRNSAQPSATRLVVFDERTSGLANGRGRVLFGHGADDGTWATLSVVDADTDAVLATGLVLGSQTEPIDLAAGEHELGLSVSSSPPAIDEGPFQIDVSAEETSVLIVVDLDTEEVSVDGAVYVLEPNTVGTIPAIPLE